VVDLLDCSSKVGLEAVDFSAAGSGSGGDANRD
jgi:hypothetical protein